MQEQEQICNNMTLQEAKEIALASDCVQNGTLKNTQICNSNTGTWWIDLDIDKEGRTPACVVNIAEKTAEINWRCTGAIQNTIKGVGASSGKNK